MNMLHQITRQLLHTGIQRAPGRAGALRRHRIISKLHQSRQLLAMTGVLHAHHMNRPGGERAATSSEHGEKDAFLFFHMIKQLNLHGLQMIGQSHRTFGMFFVHDFDAARHTDEFG